jgi:hypothetical protein
VTPIVFKSSTVNPAGPTKESNDKLAVVFIPAAQDQDFRNLRRDQKFVVKIMTTSGTSAPFGTFAWR